jgi:hypothetical protein
MANWKESGQSEVSKTMRRGPYHVCFDVGCSAGYCPWYDVVKLQCLYVSPAEVVQRLCRKSRWCSKRKTVGHAVDERAAEGN